MRTIILLLITVVCLNAKGQKIVKEYYDIMQTKIKSVYQVNNVSGVKNGTYKFYRPDGILAKTGFYKNNVETGQWKSFDFNGKLDGISNYVNGVMEGSYKDGGQVANGKFRAERIMKNGEEEQGTYYFDNGQMEKLYYKNGVCKTWREDGTIEEEWTNKDHYRVSGSTITYMKNGKPSREVKEGKTYIYSTEERDQGALSSIEYDSAGFHYSYVYNTVDGQLMRMFRDDSNAKTTQGYYYFFSDYEYFYGPTFIKNFSRAEEYNNTLNGTRLLQYSINRIDFYKGNKETFSSSYIVTLLPYKKYSEEVFDGEIIEKYGFNDKILRMKSIKIEKGKYKVTFYFNNGKVQCEYFVDKIGRMDEIFLGTGTEYNREGKKIKDISITESGSGYFREYYPSGNISVEYGLISGNNGNICSYTEYYDSGKLKSEISGNNFTDKNCLHLSFFLENANRDENTWKEDLGGNYSTWPSLMPIFYRTNYKQVFYDETGKIISTNTAK